MFRRVGCGLSRVPLEHLFSIYEIADADGGRESVPCASNVRRRKAWRRRDAGKCPSGPGTGSWRSLRLHNGSKKWVDFGVREGIREDSVTASEVVRISSLRQKRASPESFSNCRYEVATPGASNIIRGASPLGLPYAVARSRWGARIRSGGSFAALTRAACATSFALDRIRPAAGRPAGARADRRSQLSTRRHAPERAGCRAAWYAFWPSQFGADPGVPVA